MHGEVPRRKVINQAIAYNPDFFNPLYTVLVHPEKDEDTVRQALDMVNQYLEDRLPMLFQPLFDFLTEAGSPRTITEISEHFGKRLQDSWIGSACRWLGGKEIIEQVSSSLRLTKDSRISVEEPAYYYDAEDPIWEQF